MPLVISAAVAKLIGADQTARYRSESSLGCGQCWCEQPPTQTLTTVWARHYEPGHSLTGSIRPRREVPYPASGGFRGWHHGYSA